MEMKGGVGFKMHLKSMGVDGTGPDLRHTGDREEVTKVTLSLDNRDSSGS